jgi:hypothetical protein
VLHHSREYLLKHPPLAHKTYLIRGLALAPAYTQGESGIRPVNSANVLGSGCSSLHWHRGRRHACPTE